MKILIFSDLHYFAGNIEKAIFNTSKKLVSYALPFLDEIKRTVKDSGNYDFVINLGDIIQDTTEKAGDIEAMKFIFDELRSFSVPCYSVLGNHDLKMMDSVAEVEEIMRHGATHSFDRDGWHFVFLTTEVRCELGTERGGCYKAQYLSDKTLAWLDADLRKNELPALLFTHYGLAEDPEISDECMFMKNRADVKKILEGDENLRAVFYGHQHVEKTHEENGVIYYGLGSPIACTAKTGIPDGVYMEIDLSPSGEINIERRRLVI